VGMVEAKDKKNLLTIVCLAKKKLKYALNNFMEI